MENNHFESLFPENARERELKEIISYLRLGTSSQLVGLPGVGRANILQMLVHNTNVRKKYFNEYQVWIHFVHMNFSEVREREFKDVVKYMLVSLCDSLRDRNMEEAYTKVSEFLKESLMLNDEFVLYQGLKNAVEYLSSEKKLTLVFLLDRFDDYIPHVSREFFSCLRVLRDRATFRFSVVFSVSRPLEEMVEEELIKDFEEYILDHHVYVDLFDEISSSFQLAYLQQLMGKSLPQPLLEEIFRLTGKHARLFKLGVESLFSPTSPYVHVEKDTLVTPADVASLTDFLFEQKSMQKALVSIWQVISPEEQQYLKAKRYQLHRLDTEYLYKVGLLQGEKLAMPLLQLYIDRMETTSHGFIPIIYDYYTNTIKKGDILLSDKLTAAEFRLLKYLLERPEMIVTRDEIISVVWEDTKTTMGVSEQALDQLVFRLRKKIEDNPEEPQHLQTLKGRGFKFSP